MARLVSGRVKVTPFTGITSDRYEFLALEQAEPNLGDPLVGPSSIGSNPLPTPNAYVLAADPTTPGKRYWTLVESLSGSGIVTFAQTAGTALNVDGGYAYVNRLESTGITTISSGQSATSTTNAALIVSGGVGVGQSIIVGQNLIVNGIFLGKVGVATDNFFIGDRAGRTNTTGNYNHFFGKRAGSNNLNGNNNNFIGAFSGFENSNGNDNNFIGRDSGFNNLTGSLNNFFGRSSGYNNISGTNNVFIGRDSGYLNEDGSDNIFIGRGTGYFNISGSNNVSIGNSQIMPIPDGSNQLSIGIQNNRWITGDSSFNVGIGTTISDSKLTVSGNVKVSGIVTATEGFISIGNTTPIKIELVGNQLTFTAVGIGSTTLTLV
jgi:hypothetical protein